MHRVGQGFTELLNTLAWAAGALGHCIATSLWFVFSPWGGARARLLPKRLCIGCVTLLASHETEQVV